MFNRKPTPNTDGVTAAIDELLAEMHEQDKDSEHYAAMVDHLLKLYSLKEVDDKVTSDRRVSMNNLVIAGSNIFGILMIVRHERENVLTSKALSLLMKLK